MSLQQCYAPGYVGRERFGHLLGNAEFLDEDPPPLRIADFGLRDGVVGSDDELILASRSDDGTGEAAADVEGVVEEVESLGLRTVVGLKEKGVIDGVVLRLRATILLLANLGVSVASCRRCCRLWRLNPPLYQPYEQDSIL